MKSILQIFVLLLATGVSGLQAAVPREFAVDLTATVSDSAPRITLSWTQQAQANITAQKIHRRLKGGTTWVKLADLSTTQTSYADASALAGVEYEYWMERSLSLSPNTAMGYISAGVKVPEVHSRGKLLLVIDDTMVSPLAPEIDVLKQDLVGDGWTVVTITAPRTGTAISTKALIKAAYDADPTNVKQVYLLGHVPVPYSGLMAVDGHGDHYGAWPADGYYGDMDGTWTDASATQSYMTTDRLYNIPGDGKFDQSTFPSLVELQVGRVDLQNLGRSPCAADATIETTHLRAYLARAHAFRHKLGAYAAIPRRSLIRDTWGTAFGSSPFALTGWAGAYTCVGGAIDEVPQKQWFSETYAGGKSYLWGHGNGGGNFEYASEVGSSTDFGHWPSRVVFVSVFGSYHGDWDSKDNLMRSILSGNATGDSLALCCFWQGWPNWFVHSLGMGETLGYMTRGSMNAGLAGGGGYVPQGSSSRSTHLGLMGDPALRMHMVEPPRKLSASTSSGQVVLSWAASSETGVQGYHVYRATSPAGPFTKLTSTAQAGTSYTDTTTAAGTPYNYLVRTVKLESAPGGSYYNLSVGSPVAITASSAAMPSPNSPADLAISSQVSAGDARLSWQDNSSDETGFRIEQKVNAAGAWSTLATVGANATTYTATGPFTHGNVYFFRVVATGATGDSIASNTASFEASAGFVEWTARAMQVNKNAGSATVVATRFGGGTGAVTVSYSTQNHIATAGAHFTSTSGTLTWADGETGSKTITVPVTNTATQQQARQFYVTLSNPTSGVRLGVFATISVLIVDPTATLSAPWSQALLGSPTYAAPATDAEGFIGSTMVGGSWDSGRFIYQLRSGDGVMKAYIPNTASGSYSGRMALMVRASLDPAAKLGGVATCSSPGNYGTKMIYRTSTAINEVPGSTNGLQTPCWLRLTRLGLTFTAEYSADGVAWTLIAQNAVSSMPADAYWGLFHYADDLAISTDRFTVHNLSSFQNITFATVPAPAAPDGLLITANASPTSLGIQWNTKLNSAGYRIERRSEGGAYTQIADVAPGSSATQSYVDSGLTLDTAYEFRVVAYNSADSGTSPAAVGVTGLADITVTRTTDDAGGADATVASTSPGEAMGSQSLLTVAEVSAKTYLRFNLSALPGPVKSAKLKLSFIAYRGLAEMGYFYTEPNLLKDEAADVWDEATISWNNAPQNDTGSAGVLAPSQTIGYYFAYTSPAAGSLTGINLSGLTAADIGPNNLVTIVLNQSGGAAAEVDWASREHASYVPPALEMTFANPEPKRPGFLTVTPGPANKITWSDGTSDEAGFELERRAANGSWTPLATLAANATGYTDATALPGVIYEYRIRTINGAGASSWARTTTLVHSGAAAVTRAISSTDGISFTVADSARGNGYVPTGFTYYLTPTSFVTGQTLGTSIRNNVSAWMGMKISVGNAPMVVRELGRWVVSGNSAVHTVKLVNLSGVDIPGGSVSISTAGAPVGFKYAALDAPITLAANTAYYLVSNETNGGDQWYEGNSALVYDANVAAVQTAYTPNNGANWVLYNPACSFGPLAFKYSPSAIPYIAGHSMPMLRNDYTGWLGMEISVGASPIMVNQLGRWVAPGNTGTHTVKLVSAGTGADLASASIATAGAPGGQFKYAPLAAPVTLAANTTYYILSQESAGGDHWYDFSQPAAGTATGYQQWLLANGLPMDASGAGSATATPASDGLPNLIKYALGLAPNLGGNGGRLSYGPAADNDYLSLTYTRPEPAPADITYTVESSSDLAGWTTAGLVETSNTANAGLRTITVRSGTPLTGGNKSFLRLKVTQP